MKIKTAKRKYTPYTLLPVDGTKITQWVYDSGKSIRQLETEIGIFRNTIYRAMRGANLRIETIQKIARAMGVDWKELVRW